MGTPGHKLKAGKGSLRSRGLICNCPAPAELYGKSFPHKAEGVRGCHMGPDGFAKDGIPRPGCHCRACNISNLERYFNGQGTSENQREEFSIGNPDKDYRNWERDIVRWEEDMAGVPEPETMRAP